jgi:hypothetical protein
MELDLVKRLAIVILLPAVVIYFAWQVVSGLKSGHAYFPRVGYYSRELKPAGFWALICLNAVFAAAFAVGWFFLLIELIDKWH